MHKGEVVNNNYQSVTNATHSHSIKNNNNKSTPSQSKYLINNAGKNKSELS